MLIPVTISLLISTIFLNFGLALNGSFLPSARIEPARAGAVLGAVESPIASKLIVDQGSNLNQAIVKVITEAKSLPRPQLWQLPQLDQPLRQSPKDEEKKPEPIIIDFDFLAKNGVILADDNNLFFAERPDRAWPIASITKLFTAYTFLDYNPGWETSYEIKPEDKRAGGKIYLFTGDKVTGKDLFYFMLGGSDNTATAALVQATGLSEAEFVEKMNTKIKELGFKNTRLVDPAGLKDGNISTAREVALFARIALAQEEISRASLIKIHEFRTAQGRKKTIASTNALLSNFPDQGISILGGKTGHINSSGYCLVSQFKNYAGRSIVIVILGADSDSSRFDLTRELVGLYYNRQP